MSREKGEIIYKIYRCLTYCLSPAIHLHLRWRRFRGLEHSQRWPERLGRPSLPRPVGPLIWFHAVSLGYLSIYSDYYFFFLPSLFYLFIFYFSLGEGMAAIPVIKCCISRRPDVTVLMTSTTISAL